MCQTLQNSDFLFFNELASCTSLVEAAQRQGVSVAAVSKRLAQVEARACSVLLTRTGRGLALTPEGEIFLRHAQRIIAELDHLTQALQLAKDEPRGLLRVSASLGFGRAHVAPLVVRFTEAYPDTEVCLTLDPAIPTAVENAFDVCIRFGEPPDSRLIARLLASNTRIICAAPAYVARQGAPQVPADLAQHDCIDIRDGEHSFGSWRFEREALVQTVKIKGRLACNDGSVALNWALQGKGIVMRSAWEAQPLIARGELVQLLSDWRTPPAAIYAVYPQHHRGSARVKTFVELCAEQLAAVRW